MKQSSAETIVIVAFKLTWMLGQAILAYVLWQYLVADALELPKLGFIDICGIYVLLRLIISPPKLTIET